MFTVHNSRTCPHMHNSSCRLAYHNGRAPRVQMAWNYPRRCCNSGDGSGCDPQMSPKNHILQVTMTFIRITWLQLVYTALLLIQTIHRFVNSWTKSCVKNEISSKTTPHGVSRNNLQNTSPVFWRSTLHTDEGSYATLSKLQDDNVLRASLCINQICTQSRSNLPWESLQNMCSTSQGIPSPQNSV
jgi:hypothetical protein